MGIGSDYHNEGSGFSSRFKVVVPVYNEYSGPSWGIRLLVGVQMSLPKTHNIWFRDPVYKSIQRGQTRNFGHSGTILTSSDKIGSYVIGIATPFFAIAIAT